MRHCRPRRASASANQRRYEGSAAGTGGGQWRLRLCAAWPGRLALVHRRHPDQVVIREGHITQAADPHAGVLPPPPPQRPHEMAPLQLRLPGRRLGASPPASRPRRAARSCAQPPQQVGAREAQQARRARREVCAAPGGQTQGGHGGVGFREKEGGGKGKGKGARAAAAAAAMQLQLQLQLQRQRQLQLQLQLQSRNGTS